MIINIDNCTVYLPVGDHNSATLNPDRLGSIVFQRGLEDDLYHDMVGEVGPRDGRGRLVLAQRRRRAGEQQVADGQHALTVVSEIVSPTNTGATPTATPLVVISDGGRNLGCYI